MCRTLRTSSWHRSGPHLHGVRTVFSRQMDACYVARVGRESGGGAFCARVWDRPCVVGNDGALPTAAWDRKQGSNLNPRATNGSTPDDEGTADAGAATQRKEHDHEKQPGVLRRGPPTQEIPSPLKFHAAQSGDGCAAPPSLGYSGSAGSPVCSVCGRQHAGDRRKWR